MGTRGRRQYSADGSREHKQADDLSSSSASSASRSLVSERSRSSSSRARSEAPSQSSESPSAASGSRSRSASRSSALASRSRASSERSRLSSQSHASSQLRRSSVRKNKTQGTKTKKEDEDSDGYLELAVAATEYDTDLGFDPSGFPPERVYIDAIAPYGFAEVKKLEVDDELIAVNGCNVADLNKKELKDAMKKRPLKLSFERKIKKSTGKSPRIARPRTRSSMDSHRRPGFRAQPVDQRASFQGSRRASSRETLGSLASREEQVAIEAEWLVRKSDKVRAGTVLFNSLLHPVEIFRTVFDSEPKPLDRYNRTVLPGETVIADGRAEEVGGYFMVPIKPKGAVDLTAFDIVEDEIVCKTCRHVMPPDTSATFCGNCGADFCPAEDYRDLETKSAIKIQSVFRGRAGRKNADTTRRQQETEAKRKKSDRVILEDLPSRGTDHAQEHKSRIRRAKASRLIQARVRGNAARKLAEEKRRSLEQKHIREKERAALEHRLRQLESRSMAADLDAPATHPQIGERGTAANSQAVDAKKHRKLQDRVAIEQRLMQIQAKEVAKAAADRRIEDRAAAVIQARFRGNRQRRLLADDQRRRNLKKGIRMTGTAQLREKRVDPPPFCGAGRLAVAPGMGDQRDSLRNGRLMRAPQASEWREHAMAPQAMSRTVAGRGPMVGIAPRHGGAQPAGSLRSLTPPTVGNSRTTPTPPPIGHLRTLTPPPRGVRTSEAGAGSGSISSLYESSVPAVADQAASVAQGWQARQAKTAVAREDPFTEIYGNAPPPYGYGPGGVILQQAVTMRAPTPVPIVQTPEKGNAVAIDPYILEAGRANHLESLRYGHADMGDSDPFREQLLSISEKSRTEALENARSRMAAGRITHAESPVQKPSSRAAARF